MSQPSLHIAVATALTMVACPTLPGHRCAPSGDACGAAGRCEPEGVCAFAEPSCASGWAYADEAEGDLAGRCTPTVDPCRPRRSQLVDTFDAPGPAPAFRSTNADATREEAGELRVTVAAPADSAAAYESIEAFDLRGAAVEVDLAATAAVPGAYASVQVRRAAGGVTELRQGSDAGPAMVTVHIEGVAAPPGQVAARAWAPAEHIWRIREAQGELYWEVSSDRSTWTAIHHRPAPFDVSAVAIKVGAFVTLDTSAELRIADVAVCGP